MEVGDIGLGSLGSGIARRIAQSGFSLVACDIRPATLEASGAPTPTLLATIVDANGVAVEIDAGLPDGSVRRTVNFFHLGADGRISRLSIYRRSGI